MSVQPGQSSERAYDPRQVALECLDVAWKARDGDAVPIQLAIAQANALIYVGDQIAGLRGEIVGLNMPLLQQRAENALWSVESAANQIARRHG